MPNITTNYAISYTNNFTHESTKLLHTCVATFCMSQCQDGVKVLKCFE